MQRYFVKEKKDQSFLLDPNDSYHILTVMRMKIGDKIEVVFQEQLYICEITQIENGQVEVVIIDTKSEQKQGKIEITIAQALVKEAKMDFILQKTTELGVDRIIPFEAVRSVVKIDGKEEKKHQRWLRIVKEASEQSKRVRITTVLPIATIDKLCKEECELKILCTVNELSMNIKRVLQNHRDYDRIIIVVGPEGGFTLEEEKKLIEAGYLSTSLGNLVLRTETASLYMMSILNYYFMR